MMHSMGEMPKAELLAPAGNASVALAAFDAGADAVYCGLRKFNARERTENFTHEELEKIVFYAHKTHRKVYVTFNTLLKESELEEAMREIAFLAECRPDAVIVQNLGAARMIREYFPDLTLHASTQLGIHNSAGLLMAKNFGFQRVILERQVTLDELRRMVPDGRPLVELELFIHGALCCCLSGACLFSSWLGGWSGNRGKCKQPCRRRYFSQDSDPDRGKFLFSPDDLCALELLDEFRKLGVCSFKIEGRLRRSDYVEKVVRAYRMVLDADKADRKEAVSEARNLLQGAVTRKTSLGFYTPDSIRRLIRLDSFGGSGIPCGRVEKIVPGGFEAGIFNRIHLGDTLRLQSDSDAGDGFNITALYLEKDGKPVRKVQRGERCFIRSDKKAVCGDLIYRTGETAVDRSGRVAKLPLPKIPLDLQIQLREKSLTVNIAGFDRCYQCEFTPLDPARTHAVSAVDLAKVFSSAGSETFSGGEIAATVSGEWFLPLARLKELRRQFWDWAEQQVPHDLNQRRIRDVLLRFQQDRTMAEKSVQSEKFPDCTAVGKKGSAPGILAREIDCALPSEEVILPPFVPESRLERLKCKVDSLLESGARVFRITSFFQFALFPEAVRKQIVLKTMFPFPVCNSQDVLACREAGAAGVQAWIELGRRDCEDLRRYAALPLEVYAYGRPCIFMTRAILPCADGKIRDVRRNSFELKKLGDLIGLYPEETLNIPVPEGYSVFRDLRQTGEGAEKLTDFNFSREWV